jgi:type IV secretion system protein VirB4
VLHIDAVRRVATNYSDKATSHFPDPITEAIDEERRRLFESIGTLYEGYFVLTATYFPPLLAQQKFVELMFDDDTKKSDKTALTQDLIKPFRHPQPTKAWYRRPDLMVLSSLCSAQANPG